MMNWALPAYTGEGDSISLFRVQIEIKTANLTGADLDAVLRVDVGDFLNGLPFIVNVVLKHAYDYVANSNSDGFETIEVKAKIPKCFDCKNVRCQFSPEGDLLIILGFMDCVEE